MRARFRLQERRHVGWPAVDCIPANTLGHRQCQHIILRCPALATVLLLGLGVAFAIGCDMFSDAAFWNTQQAWIEFWNFVRLVCSQHGSIPNMLSLYAVEE